MNNSASGSHCTGQPKWVQFTENATNESVVSRRSHAAVWATTPAQGSGEASMNDTLVVVPILKPSTGPTARHSCGRRPKNGASRKPTNGMPTMAAPTTDTPMVSLARKSLRLSKPGGWGPDGHGPRGRSALMSILGEIVSQLSDPSRGRDQEERCSDDRDQPQGHDAKEDEHDAEGRRRRPRRAASGEHLGLGRSPSLAPPPVVRR